MNEMATDDHNQALERLGIFFFVLFTVDSSDIVFLLLKLQGLSIRSAWIFRPNFCPQYI
jgi:hypothetical protein